MQIIFLSIWYWYEYQASDLDDFWPDPDPTFEKVQIRILTKIKYLAKFLLEFALKSIFILTKTIEIPKALMAFTLTK
jgi:hypothetical protein